MKILGLNAYTHDSAAALIINGKIAAFAEEERFNREKHTGDFPEGAIAYCLDAAGLAPNDIDHIAFAWDPFYGLWSRFLRTFYIPTHSGKRLTGQAGKWFSIMNVGRRLRKMGFSGRFHYVDHYTAHAASVYYPSPFRRAAVLVIDGVGEITTAAYMKATDGGIRKFKEIHYPRSLGLFYAAATEYLGWRHNSGEGKVMGLAPYGKPEYAGDLSRIIGYSGKGEFHIDKKYFDFAADWVTDEFIKTFGERRKKGESLTDRHENMAASVQHVLEETVLAMLDWFYNTAGEENLCFTGGVALNSVLNGRIIRESKFGNFYFQPAAYDSGTSLGAALHIAAGELDRSSLEAMAHTGYGPHYSKEEIEKTLAEMEVDFMDAGGRTCELAAEALAEGKIIGWFQGRMEAGPRALGSRSILADPRKADMKDILNKKVKGREPFRPFAPSATEEDYRDYFEVSRPCPYMLVVCPVREDKRKLIPAVTHVDGTARLQTVSREVNPLYHELIRRFKALTGVPVILNTSFNLAGYPIVNTPAEAVEVYHNSDMDMLFMGDLILSKKPFGI